MKLSKIGLILVLLNLLLFIILIKNDNLLDFLDQGSIVSIFYFPSIFATIIILGFIFVFFFYLPANICLLIGYATTFFSDSFMKVSPQLIVLVFVICGAVQWYLIGYFIEKYIKKKPNKKKNIRYVK
jgi:hypothetical protein